jgi:hypothetical protein
VKKYDGKKKKKKNKKIRDILRKQTIWKKNVSISQGGRSMRTHVKLAYICILK